MPFDKRSLVVPDGTRFEEHSIVAAGDVIVGNHAKLSFGLLTQGRIFVGENVEIQGHLQTPKELRLDHFCRIKGNADVGGNAYLGERTRLEGRLRAAGDLDVGDDVAITEGFEAKGWVNIRSPVPIVTYLFLYILELLRMGKSEEVEKLLAELEGAQETIQVRDGFFYVPDGSTLGLTESFVKGNLWIGKGCRVLGNYVVDGNATVGPESKLYGALRAGGAIKVQRGAEVQGTIESPGAVSIGEDVRVLGDVRAQTVDLFQGAIVDGRLVAPGGIRFTSQRNLEMEDKVERFAADMRDDLVDLLG